MLTSIDHIGIAVKDIDASMKRYAAIFGISEFHRERVEDQGVDIASFELDGVRIELTAPLSDTSPIANFITKRGEGIHHLAFRSDALNDDLSRLKSQEISVIEPAPTMGAHDMLIAFLHPKTTGGVLMELCTPASTSGSV
jgi:methylmalonyl-CoA/ethylmalonyl-CoA epimerase